jgi:hypothetical protein
LINQHHDVTLDNLFEFWDLSALKVEEAEELAPDPKERTMTISMFTQGPFLKLSSGTFGDID